MFDGRRTHLERVSLSAVESDRAEPMPLNHATLAEQVYQRLRDDILSNVYPSDAALPEKALAAQLNVSRCLCARPFDAWHPMDS